MTQLELVVECIVPPRGSQCYELLAAMQNGERLTVGSAMANHGVYALSQRCGELRREYGWPILSRFIETAGGAKVKEYWLDRRR
jgi:hypothetical protein